MLVSDSYLKFIQQPLPFSQVFLLVVIFSLDTSEVVETQEDLVKLLLMAIKKKTLIAANQDSLV